MATPFTTGPAHAFVGFTKIQSVSNYGVVNATINGTPYYLGTDEKAPRLEFKPNWEPIYNDVSGNVPLDVAYAGEEAYISYTFTRWNEGVFELMAANPHTGFGGNTHGITSPLDRGTLMLTEGVTPTLWIVFPFAVAGKQPYVAQGLSAGYRFFAAVFEGPFQHANLGTRASKRPAIWHALPVYVPATGAFVLFDHNMAGLPMNSLGVPTGVLA